MQTTTFQHKKLKHINQKYKNMNFIQEAAEMNRRGVQLLHVGETRNAYESFSQARAMIMSYIICTKSLEGSPSLSESLLRDPTCPIDRCAKNSPSRTLAVIIPGLEDSKIYIYDRALVFHPETVSNTNDCLLYSATILFNLALCSHFIGKRNCDAIMLNHSAEMYELCLKCLPLGASYHTNHTTLLATIALNNSAQIYHETNQVQRLQQTLNSLCSMMTVFSVSSPQQQHHVENSKVLVDEILINVLVLSNPNYCYYYGAPSA